MPEKCNKLLQYNQGEKKHMKNISNSEKSFTAQIKKMQRVVTQYLNSVHLTVRKVDIITIETKTARKSFPEIC